MLFSLAAEGGEKNSPLVPSGLSDGGPSSDDQLQLPYRPSNPVLFLLDELISYFTFSDAQLLSCFVSMVTCNTVNM